VTTIVDIRRQKVNPLNAELNPIYHLLALLGAHPIFHVSGLRVNSKKKLHVSPNSGHLQIITIFAQRVSYICLYCKVMMSCVFMTDIYLIISPSIHNGDDTPQNYDIRCSQFCEGAQTGLSFNRNKSARA